MVGARNVGYRGNIPTEVTVFGSPMEAQSGTLQEKSDEEVTVGKFCFSNVYTTIYQWI